MHWDFTSLSLLYFLSGSITLTGAAINVRVPHARKGTSTLSLALLAIGLWLLSGFLEMAVVEPEYKYLFFVSANSFLALVCTITLIFIIEFFSIATWFTKWLWITWVITTFFIALGLANNLHHWFWIDFVQGPPGSNVIYFPSGFLYKVARTYFSGLVIVSFGLLVYKIIFSSGEERRLALYITGALATPFGGFLFFLLSSNKIAGLQIMPLSYAITALLIDNTVLQGFRHEVNEKTKELKTSIIQLQDEIEKRQLLELDLLQAQDILSFKLALQSSKLAGLYDLILLSNNTSIQFDLPQTCLAKITEIINCSYVLYLELDEQQNFQLVAYFGTEVDPSNFTLPVSSDWLPFSKDVLSNPSSNQLIDLPYGLRQGKNENALIKWVVIQKRPAGIVCAFWDSEYQFSVEEISLFGAVSDALGLIIDNSRLRQEIAINATNEERRRLSRDLHDSVTQSLTSLVLSSQTAINEIQNPDRLSRILKRLDTSARQSLKEMRLLLYELRLVSISKVGLIELLNNRLDAVENRAGIITELVVDPLTIWPKAWEAQLYPIAVESLNNSLKHSRASCVSIHISGSQGNFLMEIKDNGIGFDLDTIPPGGIGLKSIAERCEYLRAILEINSLPSIGTSIIIKIQPAIDFQANDLVAMETNYE